MASTRSQRPLVAGYRHGRVPREAREQHMISAAQGVFAERGYHGASMDEIAAAAGISKPMLYEYFGSKAGLYLACVERARHNLTGAIIEAVAGVEEPEQQLWNGIHAFFRFVSEHSEDWSVLFEDPVPGTGEFAVEAERIRRAVTDLIADLIEAAMAGEGNPGSEDEVRALAEALVGAGERLVVWWRRHPEVPTEQVAEYLMNLAWLGFDALLKGERWSAPATS